MYYVAIICFDSDLAAAIFKTESGWKNDEKEDVYERKNDRPVIMANLSHQSFGKYKWLSQKLRRR